MTSHKQTDNDMELDDMKNLWKEEYEELEKRISINEKKVMKMNMEKHIAGFEKSFETSIQGRNMALIYMGLSLFAAFWVRHELIYCIPVLMSSIAMLFSYNQHRILEKPNSSAMSIIALQKAISKFRIHTANHKLYDMGIVTFWILAFVPIFFKYWTGISIYENISYLTMFLIGSILFFILSLVGAHFMYKKIDDNLIETEEYLDELIEFER